MDLQRIDTQQPGELARWATQLAVPLVVLEEAVRRVGTDIDKVKGYPAAHPHPHTNPHEAEPPGADGAAG